MIHSFLINFIPSIIGCNKPNQPILYGPLLLWKAAINNRSIKANIPTVANKSKIILFYLFVVGMFVGSIIKLIKNPGFLINWIIKPPNINSRN